MIEGYKLLISGYRGFEDYDLFSNFMKTVTNEMGMPSVVLQGECKTGADQLAKRWCLEKDVKCMSFPADWSKGKRAGPERNSKMLEQVDVVCAFVHANSKGTKDVVNKARQKKMKLYELKVV